MPVPGKEDVHMWKSNQNQCLEARSGFEAPSAPATSLSMFCAVSALTLWLVACGGGSGGGGGNNAPGGATLTGTISIFEGTKIDSDVNDVFVVVNERNDPLSLAQSLPNPVVVGGYVNQSDTGSYGKYRSELAGGITGDANDYYAINLFADQVIRLEVADAQAAIPLSSGDAIQDNDIDLYLLDEAGNTVAMADGSELSKSLTVPQSARYIIQVKAQVGASNYVLSAALKSAPANAVLPVASSDLDPNAEFVPGEIIVEFSEQNRPVSASSLATLLEMQVKAGASNRAMLWQLSKDKGARKRTFFALGVAAEPLEDTPDSDTQLKHDTIEVVKALRTRAGVRSARLNYIRHAAQVPQDPGYTLQWHYPLINLPLAWDITTGGRPTGQPQIIVAVIDTGILPEHPDLQGQLVPGFDFVKNRDGLNNERDDVPGIDNDPTDPGDSLTGAGASFHGTHVAGTIAARANNFSYTAGVAWDAKVMPLRVLGPYGGTDYDIEQAVRFAAGLANDSKTLPAQRADIINLSLGGPLVGSASDVPTAFVQARQAGVIVVAAAGNEASEQLSYPAAFDGVVSVSAVDIRKQFASEYSNFGATIDVAAPGGSATDVNGDGFPDFVNSLSGQFSGSELLYTTEFKAGTSMAAPHVAGVAALMKSFDPNLTPLQFDAMLQDGALTDDLGAGGWDQYYGHGLINAYNAVRAVGGGGATPVPKAVALPSSLNFSTSRESISFTLGNAGIGELVITGVSAGTDWLTVTPVAGVVDANGVGTYNAVAQRDLLPVELGTYTDVITVLWKTAIDDPTVNQLLIPVLIQSNSGVFLDNAGLHYVILMDADSTAENNNVQQVAVFADKGQYHYSFVGVSPGNYRIVAGTDSDNDGKVCDRGEACGEYFSPGDNSRIVVDADGKVSVQRTDVVSGQRQIRQTAVFNFQTGFRVQINAAAQSPATESSPQLGYVINK
jgi:serine protease